MQNLLVFLTLIFLVSCKPVETKDNELVNILQKQKLTVGTEYGGHSYFLRDLNPAGFEYELIQGFADFLNVELSVKIFSQPEAMLKALESKEIDLVASQFLFAPYQTSKFKKGPTYQYFDLVLVSHNPDHPKVKVPNISGSLWLQKDSYASYILKKKFLKNDLNWQTHTDFDAAELLSLVASKDVDYTITDSLLLNKTKLAIPELKEVDTLADQLERRWLLEPNQDGALMGALLEYFGTLQASGQLAILQDKYFSHIAKIDYVDIREFIKSIETTLPKYRKWFNEYATEVDWTLLAALSYQESHWDPKAVSPTGVRGLMMLTQPTAKEVGVTLRTDAQESIRGGAIYFQRLYNRLPARITKPDRIYFALAAYNLGLGHLEDARVLTQRAGLNPDYWVDVKQFLPLLVKKKYYDQTRYGFARGDVAVLYVENIRRYYESLEYIIAQEELLKITLKETGYEENEL
jgi:membrane-bound lytic murein transglycosylase F